MAPTQGGGAPAAGLDAVPDGAAAVASPAAAPGAAHAAVAPVPPAEPGPPGGWQPPAGAAAAGGTHAQAPAAAPAAMAAAQQPGPDADDGHDRHDDPPPPPFWPEPQSRWLSQSLTVRLLQRWTTAELENFLLSMWEEMLQVRQLPKSTKLLLYPLEFTDWSTMLETVTDVNAGICFCITPKYGPCHGLAGYAFLDTTGFSGGMPGPCQECLIPACWAASTTSDAANAASATDAEVMLCEQDHFISVSSNMLALRH